MRIKNGTHFKIATLLADVWLVVLLMSLSFGAGVLLIRTTIHVGLLLGDASGGVARLFKTITILLPS